MCFTVELSMREHLVKQSRRRRLNLVRNVVLLTEGSRTSDDHISGGDALRGNTRSHPEHDG